MVWYFFLPKVPTSPQEGSEHVAGHCLPGAAARLFAWKPVENVCFSLSRPAPGTRVVAKTEHVSKLSVWYGRRFQGHTRPRLTGVGQQSGPKAGFGRPDPDGPRPGPARKARDGPGFYKGALTFAFFSMFFFVFSQNQCVQKRKFLRRRPA